QLRRWVNALDQQPSALVTVGEYHRKPVGFLIGEADTTPNPLSEWQKRAFIHALWVSPEHRKQGIGRKLVETFEAAIREYDIPYCDLAYHPKNEIAQRFWQAVGYQPAQMTARKIFGLQEIEQA
ncbi:MAG: GNAT family N-acetyltransferase, partial [Gammaproteobacteria bacterium]